ncbi:MAG: extracellular solute-binding protein [Armatimonadota bacterium]
MMRRQLLAAFVLAVIGSLLLVPSGQPTPQAAAKVAVAIASVASAAAAPAPAPAPPRARVTLKFIANQNDEQIIAFKKILEAFQKSEGGKWAHVDLAIEAVPFVELFPKILTSVAVGAEMDLIQADGPVMKHYAFNRVLTPLGRHFTVREMRQWHPTSIAEGSFRGQLYGPPIMQSCSMLMYNREFTDAAGIRPPTRLDESWTMDQALEAWKRTTRDLNGDGVPDIWGVRLGQGVSYADYETGIWRRSNGERGSNTFKGVADDGVTFRGYLDTPEAIEAMQFFQELHLVHKVTPIEPVPNIFESKKAAFMITPDNRIGAINRLYRDGSFRWGVTGIPYFKTQLCHTGSWHYGISANTKKLNEALAFVKFAAGREGSRIWYDNVRQLPANLEIYNQLSEYRSGGQQELFFEGMTRIGVPRVQTPGYQEYFQFFLEMATNISTGANVRQEMEAAVRRIEAALRRYRGWNQ